MKRSFDSAVLEMMDRPLAVSPELESDLRNLRLLNRYFGSYALIRFFLHRWIKPGDRLRILDIATGSGDIPRLIADYAQAIGAEAQIDALDRQGATLEIARSLSAGYPNIEFIAADVFKWEPDEPYDLVCCSLALHHFSEEDATRLLGLARRWSRRFVLVTDIRRSRLGSIGVFLLTAFIFRDPMTRYDGRLSMARAFSFAEMRQLAQQAGWKDFGQRKFRFSRQAIWLE